MEERLDAIHDLREVLELLQEHGTEVRVVVTFSLGTPTATVGIETLSGDESVYFTVEP